METLVRAAANRNAIAVNLLTFDQAAANKQAVATCNNITVPGVEFYAEKSLSVRTK
jgi:hypothetical protein